MVEKLGRLLATETGRKLRVLTVVCETGLKYLDGDLYRQAH